VKLIQKCDPREVDSIRLGEDSYVDRLYGCFRFDNPRADGFATEREVEIIFPSPLPENMTEKLEEAMMKKELGVPAEQLLRELGYES